HEQELKMTLKKLSERQLQIQQCKVQEIDKQKLEAHSSYMAKIQEVSPDESSSTSQGTICVNSISMIARVNAPC
ncbi:hypothetical protein Tco_0423606, partial [Tanacetum coccineum]